MYIISATIHNVRDVLKRNAKSKRRPFLSLFTRAIAGIIALYIVCRVNGLFKEISNSPAVNVAPIFM